jgi:hypothetical protein
MSVTHNSLRLFVAFHIVTRMNLFISAWERGSTRVSLLARGWEGRGGGRIPFNFWCRREYNYPSHILLFSTIHYTLLIIVVFNEIDFLNEC